VLVESVGLVADRRESSPAKVHDCPLAVAPGREPPFAPQERRGAQMPRQWVARRKVAPPDWAVPEQAVQQTMQPLVVLLVQRGE
jgi:hypothetical protein